MLLNDNSIESNIPYYLTQEAKLGLIKALKDFPEKTNYYTNQVPHEMLQGDGLNSLTVIDFYTGKTKAIKGVLLSNSCDMDINNRREFPIKLTFAPLIELNKGDGKK
ncbi:hypothetical protein [Methyloprofundus sp.]|uniref:hypothetical protein n=1 Tax=Methyloprofundus sp. TaxID=2020875 RepID=UPI003D0B3882